MSTVPYKPIPGWFDLSKLDLPREKFEAYRQLQVLGEQYQRTIQYQKEHNKPQFEKLKELCAEMNIDLILNCGALDKAAQAGKELSRMRIDLLKRWLKMYPYGYCDGINFQTCRANESCCPYCMANVHCSDGNSAIDYYREMIRFRRMKPRKAAKIALWFAETLPSIMRSLDMENRGREREVSRMTAYGETELFSVLRDVLLELSRIVSRLEAVEKAIKEAEQSDT